MIVMNGSIQALMLKPGDVILVESDDNGTQVAQVVTAVAVGRAVHVTYDIGWTWGEPETYTQAFDRYHHLPAVIIDHDTNDRDEAIIELLISLGVAAPAARDMLLGDVLDQIKGANAL